MPHFKKSVAYKMRGNVVVSSPKHEKQSSEHRKEKCLIQLNGHE